MSGKDSNALIIGGEPRIDFLPPEVRAGKQARKTRRGLVAIVLVVLAGVAAGVVFATTLAIDAQLRLADEQDRTAALLAEQNEYIEARTLASTVATATSARVVGAATEIDWNKYLGAVQSTLPDGVYLEGLGAAAQNPFDVGMIPEQLLEKPRIATITFTGMSVGVAQIDTWMDNLESIAGFADVYFSKAVLDESSGLYEVNVRLHINADVYENRYIDAESTDVASTDEAE